MRIAHLIRTVLIMVGLSYTAQAEKKPNILLFIVDDMGVMDTSQPMLTDAKGTLKKYPLNDFYITPAIEKMSSDGVIFSTFYANSVCSPSRTSLLNGQSSARHRVTQWIDPFKRNAGPKGWKWEGFSKDDVVLPKLMQKAGYHTIFCGKAHMGAHKKYAEDPRNVGFDVNIAGCSIGRPDSYYGEKNYGKGGKRAVPGLEQYHSTNTFLTEALTLEVNKAIERGVKEGKPLFIEMSHYAVHSPFDSDPRFADNYKSSGKSAKAQAFATLIEGMDKSLGDIIEKLDALGEAENTIVIFLGDNGSDAPLGGKYDYASSAPLRGMKGTHYEGGMRAPLIMSWAKPNPDSPLQQSFPIKSGVVASDFTTIMDIFPTVLDAVGVKAPASHKIDGESLRSYLASHEGDRKQEFLMHFPHPHRSSYFTVYRRGDWKMIYHYRKPEGKRVELFYLKADPIESKNLADKEKAKVKELLAGMKNALDDAGALHVTNKEGEKILPVL